jgi:2-polyprenyl-3-methyl-5-hydroxy-6-metoxy-1,4-benzoquinol methylase
LARTLAERGFEVTAIEPSPDGLELARRVPSRATFLQASVYETLGAVAGTGFDFAVSTEVIEHLSRPKELFARAQELLKVSGTLILTTPYHGYMKNLALSLLDGWDAHFGVDWEGGHIKFFSNNTLRKMGREYGFDRPRFFGVGRLPYLWKSTVMVVKRER